jgi:hypothetical membrane protein
LKFSEKSSAKAPKQIFVSGILAACAETPRARIIVFVPVAAGMVLPEILGFLADDYRSTSNYLSELGAVDAPYTFVINYFGFLPVGLTILVLVGLLWRRLPRNGLVNVGLVCLLGDIKCFPEVQP